MAETSVGAFVAKHPTALVQKLGNGDFSVLMPAVVLDPSTWSRAQCQVAFVVPAAFPVQRPDCFWTDGDLQLKNGQMPANSQIGQPHPLYAGMRWFSYHPNVWDVRDSVETYWHLIQGRLLLAR